MNTIEHLAVTTGSAVAMAGHFSKGNASAKETIDRISGSGVFARDPDSLLIFTPHEEDAAFTVESVLRNFAPVKPFVVKWRWPTFQREESLDPANLKRGGGRPPKHKPEALLKCLGKKRLRTFEWTKLAKEECGVPPSTFFELLNALQEQGKVQKSSVDEKWGEITPTPKTSYHEKDQ